MALVIPTLTPIHKPGFIISQPWNPDLEKEPGVRITSAYDHSRCFYRSYSSTTSATNPQFACCWQQKHHTVKNVMWFSNNLQFVYSLVNHAFKRLNFFLLGHVSWTTKNVCSMSSSSFIACQWCQWNKNSKERKIIPAVIVIIIINVIMPYICQRKPIVHCNENRYKSII